MKVLLVGINSKYIHSCLAVEYLAAYCNDLDIDIQVAQYTINQTDDFIVSDIFKKEADVVAFSCYIWNIEEVLKISNILKIVNPKVNIVLGGPEVSYDAIDIMKINDFIDFIIYGEGEETFKDFLLQTYYGKPEYESVLGLVYRDNQDIYMNKERPLIMDLDTIPSPFCGDLNRFENKIVYFESSRGCPFNCKFCLSSTIKGLRFFSIERVKRDLANLISAGVKQVKFVDRTFNASKNYAMDIMNFIMEKGVKNINFHFEVTAHLLDDEMLQFLKKVPEGLFQFEIGVQSTKDETLEAVGREWNFERLKRVTKTIKSYGNIHQHLDLIAGLPYEGYLDFKDSFNDVYELEPDKLQLGFLKLLKGSELRRDSSLYGFKFLNAPPYEVLETNFIDYKDMLKLKNIEDLVEKYGNDNSFRHSLRFIINNFYETPFDFYESFSLFWESDGYYNISHSKKNLYSILYSFYQKHILDKIDIFNEMLKFDYLSNNKSTNLPKEIKRQGLEFIKTRRHEFLKNRANILKYLPLFDGISTKQIIKEVYFELFALDIYKIIHNNYEVEGLSLSKENQHVILFDYSYKTAVFNYCKPVDVTLDFMI
ncbi:B12-binding domain-containing radical SAM protein [Clostridiisalibacter paucivorans]|uniref:B12-binding domain-containing radical SAM protein n=1 Tax=Clostridiisalibacter paucivorans TaxID=408753 RepID=UPI0005577072|nr:B12-binding domain-containing radical SAM protein [Clostridiisalibacter paucivorans]